MWRAVVAELDTTFRASLVEYLSKKPEIEIVGCAADGIETEAMLKRTRPDILLLDMVMPRLDGLALLCRMREDPYLRDVQVIVMTQLHSGALIQATAAYGVLFYMVKPFDMECLYGKIAMLDDIAPALCTQAQTEQSAPNIAQLVAQAGISAANKGYRYVCESLYVVKREKKYGRVTKDIYPQVAKRFGVNVIAVERAIRGAIDHAWRRGSIEQSGMFVHDRRPTNAELIAQLATYVIPDACGVMSRCDSVPDGSRI